jgi:hypothetical protein
MPPQILTDNLVRDLLGQEQNRRGGINNRRKVAVSWAEQGAMTISAAGLDIRSSMSVDGKDGDPDMNHEQ